MELGHGSAAIRNGLMLVSLEWVGPHGTGLIPVGMSYCRDRRLLNPSSAYTYLVMPTSTTSSLELSLEREKPLFFTKCPDPLCTGKLLNCPPWQLLTGRAQPGWSLSMPTCPQPELRTQMMAQPSPRFLGPHLPRDSLKRMAGKPKLARSNVTCPES